MSTMQSTIERIADEERKPDPVPGWQPAGPPLTDAVDAMRAAEKEIREVTQIYDFPLGPHPSQLIPSIGHMVVYHLRDGDSRNMRTKFPATVLDCDPTTGLLSLIITVDAGDEWRQDRVPSRVVPEPGWEPIIQESALKLAARVAALEAELAEITRLTNSARLIVPEGMEFNVADKRPGNITWAEPGETILITELDARLNDVEQNIIRITAARANLLSENAAIETRLTEAEHQLELHRQGANIPASIFTRLAALEAKPKLGRPPKPKE